MEYTAKADVGGRLGQLGGRLIDATANEFASDFFEKFAAIVGKPQAMEAEVGASQKAGWLGKLFGASVASLLFLGLYGNLGGLNGHAHAKKAAILPAIGASGKQRLVRDADVDSDPIADILKEHSQLSKSSMVEWNGEQLFLRVETPPVRLVVIGAVPISQMLAPVASLAGFDMIIIDPRTAFVTPERFPGVQLIPEWPELALPSLHLDHYTAMVLLTHDPRIDDQGLIEALRADCFYIGALGSPKTRTKRLERMRTKGFGNTMLKRVRAPIGLDIGAVSPAEIAISIAGEIIAELHRKVLRRENGEGRVKFGPLPIAESEARCPRR
jgi:xanthine dehydrogenase accessory factor